MTEISNLSQLVLINIISVLKSLVAEYSEEHNGL